MRSLYSYLLSKKYPQYLWAKEISTLMRDLKIDVECEHIYDAPGGAGFVSNALAQDLDKNFHVYDIDDDKLNAGQAAFASDNIEFRNIDLYTATFEQNSTWLLVNSLYLLDGLETVIQNNMNNVSHIIGVFPYLNTKNYTYFKENISPDLNSNEMSKEQTIEFFKSHKYELVIDKNTTYFSYLKLSKIPVAKHVAALLFTVLESLLNLKGDIYWIGVFKRKDNETR